VITWGKAPSFLETKQKQNRTKIEDVHAEVQRFTKVISRVQLPGKTLDAIFSQVEHVP
jgi:hypothetical protein